MQILSALRTALNLHRAEKGARADGVTHARTYSGSESGSMSNRGPRRSAPSIYTLKERLHAYFPTEHSVEKSLPPAQQHVQRITKRKRVLQKKKRENIFFENAICEWTAHSITHCQCCRRYRNRVTR